MAVWKFWDPWLCFSLNFHTLMDLVELPSGEWGPHSAVRAAWSALAYWLATGNAGAPLLTHQEREPLPMHLAPSDSGQEAWSPSLPLPAEALASGTLVAESILKAWDPLGQPEVKSHDGSLVSSGLMERKVR